MRKPSPAPMRSEPNDTMRSKDPHDEARCDRTTGTNGEPVYNWQAGRNRPQIMTEPLSGMGPRPSSSRGQAKRGGAAGGYGDEY